jgi:hypothetical protein
MPKTKVKQPKFTEPYWKSIVGTYLLFMQIKFNYKVELTGSSPRDLKEITKRLRELANEGNVVWDKPTACRTFHLFLHFAWEYKMAPHCDKFFVIGCNKRKEEILDAISQYKQKRQNENIASDIKKEVV